MFTPEEFRAYSKKLESMGNPKITGKGLLLHVTKGIGLFIPVIALAIWSEVSFQNTADLKNPTVYLCILYFALVALWAIPKLKTMWKEMVINLPVCPFCQHRINTQTIRLVMISDRCPNCGRIIVSPSLKELPELGDGDNSVTASPSLHVTS